MGGSDAVTQKSGMPGELTLDQQLRRWLAGIVGVKLAGMLIEDHEPPDTFRDILELDRLARQLGLQQRETRRRLGFDMRIAADEHRQLTAAAASEFLRIETRLDRCKAAGYPFVMGLDGHAQRVLVPPRVPVSEDLSLAALDVAFDQIGAVPAARTEVLVPTTCVPLSPETAAKCVPQSPSSWPLTANVAGLLQTAPLSRKIRG